MHKTIIKSYSFFKLYQLLLGNPKLSFIDFIVLELNENKTSPR